MVKKKSKQTPKAKLHNPILLYFSVLTYLTTQKLFFTFLVYVKIVEFL